MQNLAAVPSGDLVDMLMKHTEYYLSILKQDDKDAKKAESKKYIDLIIEEIRSRKACGGLSPDDRSDIKLR